MRVCYVLDPFARDARHPNRCGPGVQRILPQVPVQLFAIAKRQLKGH